MILPTDFKKLAAARFLYTFGVQIQAVMLGWQMYSLTGSALFLGLIGLVEAIPALGLALHAGYSVDHGKPLRIYRNVLMISFLSAVVMMFSQLPTFGLSIEIKIVALFIASALTGTARAFAQPSIFAIVPQLVARENLSRAAAFMSSAMQTARVSGPAVGGIIFGLVDISFSLALVCIVLLGALVSTLLMNPLPDSSQKKSVKPFREELFAGARYVLKHPILFPALSLDMISVLFGGVTALLPIFAVEILHVGPLGLGMLRASPAVGAAIMGIVLTSISITHQAGKLLFIAVTGFGLCILVFALSRNFELSVAALIVSGAFDSVSMIIRSSAVQLLSPESMRGRISAVNSIFVGSSNEIGEFESGIMASLMGVQPAAVFGGFACLATVLGIMYVFPKLRTLNLANLAPPSAR